MSMFSIFGISGSAVSAQSQRLNVVASNLANADAVAGPDGQAYKARQVVFQTVPMGGDASAGVRSDYTVQTAPTMDGNSVDLDRERAAFADNAVRYEATLRFINGEGKTMLAAIQGQ